MTTNADSNLSNAKHFVNRNTIFVIRYFVRNTSALRVQYTLLYSIHTLDYEETKLYDEQFWFLKLYLLKLKF